MNILKSIKYIICFLLTFLLGSQTTYAKTELVLTQNQVVFSIEQNQSFKSLEKEVQPNIGFLKEKYRFVILQSVSAVKSYDFSERVYEYLANGGGDVLPQVFGGARQYVRNTYPNGQDILNSLTQKFGNNQGAAAEIIKKFGDDGLAILNKSTVSSIDDAAKELIQGKTLYRYVNETSYNFDKLLTKGQIDAAPSQFPGYTTLDNITDATQAKSTLQLPKKPTWVAEFDAAQIIDDVSFPMGNFNSASYKEVVTRSYPNFGTGGGSQFITTSEIKISRLKNLATGEVIDFTHTAKRTYAAKGQGTDLIRTTFSTNNTKIQIKSGHGFNRSHTTGDFANTNLTMNQVEDAVIDDFNIRISNGDNIPTVGSNNFNGPANFTLDVDGVSVGYRVVNLQDGSVSISTYCQIK